MNDEYWNILDNIITLDLNMRGVVQELAETLRQVKGKRYLKNLCLKFSKVLDYGSEVFIFTGFPIPPTYNFETDGPLGAVVLAKALSNLNVKPVIIVEKELIGVIAKLALTLKMKVKVGRSTYKGLGIIGFPLDKYKAQEETLRLLSRFQPTALVFVEKPGRTLDGKYCTMKLEDITDHVSKVDQFIPLAKKLDILTIGIGDGGNEIGMGMLYKLSSKVTVVTKTDELIVSTISNWGVYALIAGLSLIKGKTDIIHKPEHEERLIREAARVGLIDGVLKHRSFSVDACPIDINRHVVGLIRSHTINCIRC